MVRLNFSAATVEIPEYLDIEISIAENHPIVELTVVASVSDLRYLDRQHEVAWAVPSELAQWD